MVAHLSHILIAEEERGQHRYFLGDEILLRTARGLMRGAGLEDATPIVSGRRGRPPAAGKCRARAASERVPGPRLPAGRAGSGDLSATRISVRPC